jgi:hypothetical protein
MKKSMGILLLIVGIVSAFGQSSKPTAKRIYIEQYSTAGSIASVTCGTPGSCIGSGAVIERDALHVEQAIEVSGHTANWEMVLQTAQRRARELFQLALLDLDNDVPLTLVLETFSRPSRSVS